MSTQISRYAALIAMATTQPAAAQINVQQMIGGALGAAQSQQAAADWNKAPALLKTCVNISLERNRANINTLIQRGIGPNDPRVAQVRQICEQFTNKKFRENFACNLTAPGGQTISTRCDEAFAQQVPNGTVQRLTLDQAMRESANNRPVVLGQFERQDALTQRQSNNQAQTAQVQPPPRARPQPIPFNPPNVGTNSSTLPNSTSPSQAQSTERSATTQEADLQPTGTKQTLLSSADENTFAVIAIGQSQNVCALGDDIDQTENDIILRNADVSSWIKSTNRLNSFGALKFKNINELENIVGKNYSECAFLLGSVKTLNPVAVTLQYERRAWEVYGKILPAASPNRQALLKKKEADDAQQAEWNRNNSSANRIELSAQAKAVITKLKSDLITKIANSNKAKCAAEDRGLWHDCFASKIIKRGSSYEGEWQYGLPGGFGHFKTDDGEDYFGSVQYGNFQGDGTLLKSGGEVIIGEFRMNRALGQAKVIYTDGNQYVGRVRDGKPDGYGTMSLVNGAVLSQGVWNLGKLTKPGSAQESASDYTEDREFKNLKKFYEIVNSSPYQGKPNAIDMLANCAATYKVLSDAYSGMNVESWNAKISANVSSEAYLFASKSATSAFFGQTSGYVNTLVDRNADSLSKARPEYISDYAFFAQTIEAQCDEVLVANEKLNSEYKKKTEELMSVAKSQFKEKEVTAIFSCTDKSNSGEDQLTARNLARAIIDGDNIKYGIMMTNSVYAIYCSAVNQRINSNIVDRLDVVGNSGIGGSVYFMGRINPNTTIFVSQLQQ